MRAILALCIPVLALGCHDDPAKPAAAHPATSASTEARASTFGRPIEGGETASLVDIAKSPASYKGKVVATEGTVTRVCQERGCWMAIKDDSGTATVRMHGHTFFVPTTSAGKHARVEGTVVLMKDGRECDDLEALDAKLELDATGVELM
jgi:RNase P/RNase MRP subunit p29